MEPKISVIVPAYNNAPWLPATLDSILAQSHQNLEIIVVDDGSTDDTAAVLQTYAEKDPRIHPIRKANGGVTSARLLGVAESTGDWIGFVDGDDIIEPQMYARLLENAFANDADISHCGQRMVYPDGKVQYYYNSGTLRPQDRLLGLRDLLEETLVEPGLCNKLYKRQLFDGLEEKMDLNIKNNEDFLMNYYLFSGADKSIFEDVCPYHYLIRQGSASRRRLNEHLIYDPIRVKQIILEHCGEELREDALRALTGTCLYVYAKLMLEPGEEFDDHRERVRQLLMEQKAHIHLLSKRNALLLRLTCYAPWLFFLIYRVYAFVFGKQ